MTMMTMMGGSQSRSTTCRRRRCRWRDSSGSSLVEAALITPLLLLLTFALIDFGSIFYAYLALENGVGQATRYGVTGNQVAGISRESSIMKAMRDATPTLAIADGAFAFSHLSPGTVVWTAGAGGPNDVEKVTVTYPWQLMTPMVRVFFPGGRVTLTVESAMKNEPRFN
jgi:Flp pilus assembly protein TadG